MVGQASISEFGTIWGEPGNQKRTKGKLDGELNVIALSPSTWTYIYRCTNEAAREKIAYTMEGCVANANFGYSQNNGASPRTTAFDALKEVGWEPSKVAKKVNCDCSSLVSCCVNAAGIPVSKDMYTGSQDELLMKTGKFEKITKGLKDEATYKRGDILWRQGHTAVCLDDGADPIPSGTPTKFEVVNGQVYMRSGPASYYKDICVLPCGTIVDGYSSQGNWEYVRYDNRNGYVSLSYLRPYSASKEMKKMRVKRGVHIRKGIGTSYESLDVLDPGTEVLTDGQNGKNTDGQVWLYCQVGAIKGWINSGYLEPIQDAKTYFRVTGGSVFIRRDAGTNNAEVGSALIGSLLESDGSFKYVGTRKWYQVKYGTISGYASELYLTKVR